jgi:hypothetical protein
MADLNIRNAPEELIKLLKKSALEAGMSLRSYCLASLSQGLQNLDDLKLNAITIIPSQLEDAPHRSDCCCPNCGAIRGHQKWCKA